MKYKKMITFIAISIIGLVLLAACSTNSNWLGKAQSTGNIHAKSTASSDIVYMPVILQGAMPTPKATASAGSIPARVISGSLLVTSAVSSQYANGSQYTVDLQGEVRNNSDTAVQSVRVIVEGSGGGKICGRSVLTLLGQSEAVINPGESWPFKGVFDCSCQIEEVAFTVTGVQTNAQQIRITPAQLQIGTTSTGDWSLTGVMKNGYSFNLYYPRVVVTLYNGSGTYQASTVVYADIANLSPGGVAVFTAIIPGDQAAGWSRYVAVGTGEKH